MNLAVIGSGGREHAICYKLKQSPKIKKLICIPGNAGTQKLAENIKEDISNFEALYQIIKKQEIDVVIVAIYNKLHVHDHHFLSLLNSYNIIIIKYT
jgi:phosphoribosylamine--glycine ligase